jgi:hypothetical protein
VPCPCLPQSDDLSSGVVEGLDTHCSSLLHPSHFTPHHFLFHLAPCPPRMRSLSQQLPITNVQTIQHLCFSPRPRPHSPLCQSKCTSTRHLASSSIFRLIERPALGFGKMPTPAILPSYSSVHESLLLALRTPSRTKHSRDAGFPLRQGLIFLLQCCHAPSGVSCAQAPQTGSMSYLFHRFN